MNKVVNYDLFCHGEEFKKIANESLAIIEMNIKNNKSIFNSSKTKLEVKEQKEDQRVDSANKEFFVRDAVKKTIENNNYFLENDLKYIDKNNSDEFNINWGTQFSCDFGIINLVKGIFIPVDIKIVSTKTAAANVGGGKRGILYTLCGNYPGDKIKKCKFMDYLNKYGSKTEYIKDFFFLVIFDSNIEASYYTSLRQFDYNFIRPNGSNFPFQAQYSKTINRINNRTHQEEYDLITKTFFDSFMYVIIEDLYVFSRMNENSPEYYNFRINKMLEKFFHDLEKESI